MWKTSRFVIEPADIYERAEPDHAGDPRDVARPALHGAVRPPAAPLSRQGADLPASRRRGQCASRPSGSVSSTVRGSGNHDRRFDEKGGVGAFWAMREALSEGCEHGSHRRRAARSRGWRALGIIKLARESGTTDLSPWPSPPAAGIDFNSWDRAALNLPFSRGAMVGRRTDSRRQRKLTRRRSKQRGKRSSGRSMR